MIQDKSLYQQNIANTTKSRADLSTIYNNNLSKMPNLNPKLPKLVPVNNLLSTTVRDIQAPQKLAKTTVIELEDGLFGHTALHIDDDGTGHEFLFDPAGSYIPSNASRGGDLFSGENANLDAYKKFWERRGETVNLYKLDTTSAQEQEIIRRAEDIGMAQPGTCASSVSSALNGVCGIEGSMWPSTLGENASNAKCD
ncbi:MAG: hypothetical protein CSA79_01915 [Thiothrix nivea]|nr:MAG: hypothetical protein CSA79_01915 [Thiothrix nivea]